MHAQPVGILVKMFPKLSETFVLEEVLGLERLGTQVRLYTLMPSSDEQTHAAAARVRAPITAVPRLGWPTVGTFLARHARQFAASPLRYVTALGRAASRGRPGMAAFARAGWLASQLARDGVDHLHAHFISTPTDVAELVAGLTGKPFSISAHAKDIYLGDTQDLRRKLEAAAFTVTCTDFNRQSLRTIAPQARVHRMYHGIDHGVFHVGCSCVDRSPAAVPLVLAVGRLREKKGFDTLIDACQLLRVRGERFRCEIVGYGEQRDRLQRLIDDRGLGDVVTLAGKCTREQLLARYGAASAFVQPSRIANDGDRDGIPNVLLEAMAVGVPVVATTVSGIPEVIRHRHNGLLVEPDAPADLAKSLGELLDDRRRGGALAAALSEAARATVLEHFDNDRNLRVVLGLLGREPRSLTEVACAI